MRTAFVSIKGRDYRWFRDALARGDLALVKATAAQLSAVDLATALEITLLIASEEPHNAERAARYGGSGGGRSSRARRRSTGLKGGRGT